MFDSFVPLQTVKLHGPLGSMLDKVIKNRLLKIDYRQLVEPFRLRNETDYKWRCEFWGKIVRSAIYAWKSTQDPDLKKQIDFTVYDLLSTQTDDGCISSYPEDKQLSGWDIWGRKYVLLGLLAYYREMNSDPFILKKIHRCALHLSKQAGRLQDYGLHYGMAAGSILRAFVEIADLCCDNELMDAAKKLADASCNHLHNIFTAAKIGVSPAELANGKAYEMTSCFQGLGVLYTLDRDIEKLNSLNNYYHSVQEKEIFITGGGGLKDANGEFWYNGASRQYRTDCGGMGETCVTSTWLWYSKQMLSLTGDSTIADDMERALYNALLGAFQADGENVTHINPFLCGGWKCPAGEQIAGFTGHDCCRAQGPYGLSSAPQIAVMQNKNGYIVNLYEDLTAEGVLKITGGYPAKNKSVITLLKNGEFELILRIPRDFSCKIDGKSVNSGTYYHLKRNWKVNDKIELEFDFSIRTIEHCGYTAHLCGPLVLCKEYGADENRPFICKNGEYVDYASAGMKFSPDNTLVVWEQYETNFLNVK